MAVLLAYRGGELSADDHSKVRAHLLRCHRCQEVVISIEEDLAIFERLTSDKAVITFQLERGLLKLQSAIEDRIGNREKISRNECDFESCSRVHELVQAELALYLGSRAAERILSRVKTQVFTSQDLANAVEPLMANLLGTQGASAVARKVGLLCELASSPGRPRVTL